ncbi:MAG: carbamoyltransferase HypF [Firmicutes bacterium]|nr:carbamoyltransferase HypF [Bacillota bacterium]
MVRLAHEERAVEIRVTGIVQGVGFRPHVYKSAVSLGLNGWVINTTAGVTIRLEGEARKVAQFIDDLREFPPPLSRIERLSVKDVELEGFSTFFIHESQSVSDTDVSIPPDVGTCPDCLREFWNAKDRRYGYPFINCVNCGPRFSITRAAPYDRKNTSMQAFKMCKDCAAEYRDPTDRRFHAEPNACPACGPQLMLTSADGAPINEDIRALLKMGYILAIKGIGGYHLACNAHNSRAVRLLRERKRRHAKPFALMCRDLETVRRYCRLSAREEEVLTSPARPIVLLERRLSSELCEDIAPGLDTLGVMLPYTALHYGLFDEELSILVMTSANISGDPLIITEEDAYAHLSDLADAFVIHKREIVNRADDSVVMLFDKNPYLIRRSRGYVPQGIRLPLTVSAVFAAGGDLKSVFAYAQKDKAILSQYFGDLDNLKNLDAYKKGAQFFSEFLKIRPEKVVCDLHPDYVSAKFAQAYAQDLNMPLIKVQHHKAHFASAMADNNLNEKVLGIVCDGTGYGEDGTVWGFEFFYGDYYGIERVGSLMPFIQPRGDGVIKNPLQMAAVLLFDMWEDKDKVLEVLPDSGGLLPFVEAQIKSDSLGIASSSCGRLFDAAAALCGFTGRVTYEGEAAMRMEAMAHRASEAKPYGYEIIEDKMLYLSWSFVRDMAEDKLRGTNADMLAARFHQTIATAICDMIKRLAARYRTDKVVFSGGTFQNRFIASRLAKALPRYSIEPYFHRQVPTNDGGIALGQLLLAAGDNSTGL